MTKIMPTQELREQIVTALQMLSGICDGAVKQDNIGFNAFDSEIGKSLAAQAPNLTSKQFELAHKIIYKYRRQHGFEMPHYNQVNWIDTVVAGGNGKTKKKIDLVENQIHIYFYGRPSPDDRKLLDRLPYRRWNPDLPNKPWETPAANALAVFNLFGERNDFELTDVFMGMVNYCRKQTGAVDTRQYDRKYKLDIQNNRILVYLWGYRKEWVDVIKNQFQDRKWEPDLPDKPWSISVSEIEKVFDIFPDKDGSLFEHTPSFTAEVQKMRQLRELSRAQESDFDVKGLGLTLFPFQRSGVEFLDLADGRALLADEMGLGKTIVAAAYLQLHENKRPAIIIVPASLKINWQRELERVLTSNKRIATLNSRTPIAHEELAEMADIFIINYDIITYWKDELMKLKPQVLICDEAHFVVNYKAKRTKAVKAIANQAPHVIHLTGTPMKNKPVELFSLLNMLYPNVWSNWFSFATRYNSYERGYGLGAPKNLDELHEKVKPYMLRRTKAEVMTELPPILRSTIVLEFDAKERKNYDDYIRQALSSSSHAEHLAYIEKAKQAAALGKMDATIAWIENFLEQGKKLVVFATHKMIVEILTKKFADVCVEVSGRTSKINRQAAVDAFQNDDRVRLFVGNVDAAGVGITLTAASDVVLLEYPWTPDRIEQAIARCHRIGQNDSVTAYHLVADRE